jgi:hypothetical protein
MDQQEADAGIEDALENWPDHERWAVRGHYVPQPEAWIFSVKFDGNWLTDRNHPESWPWIDEDVSNFTAVPGKTVVRQRVRGMLEEFSRPRTLTLVRPSGIPTRGHLTVKPTNLTPSGARPSGGALGLERS